MFEVGTFLNDVGTDRFEENSEIAEKGDFDNREQNIDEEDEVTPV